MLAGRKSSGHPVDIASGTVYSTHSDYSIPGRVPLTWERRYSTALLNQPPSPLGPGWTCRYFASLKPDGEAYHFLSPEGEIEIFSDPENTLQRGATVRNPGTFQELARRGRQYIVTRWDVETGKIERFCFQEGKSDAAWPLTAIENPSGQGLDLIRDDNGRLIGIEQRLEKRALVIDYDKAGRIRSISFALPRNQRQTLASYDYDADGRLLAAHDARGHADQYAYDPNGRLIREFTKSGGVFEFQYDDQGRCVRTAGQGGYDEKRFNYLASIGWTEVTDSRGHVTRYQWLPSGQVIQEINPLGGIRKTAYDEHGRIASTTDPNAGVTSYAYDAEGNRGIITDALGQVFQYLYNASHQVVQYTNSAGHTWQWHYDARNLLIAAENPEGQLYRLAYDGQGSLSEVTDPLGNHLRLTFTPEGRLAASTDWAGNTNHYQEDPFGRLTEWIDPLGHPTIYHYDAAGNLIRIDYADGTYAEYAYDPAGKPTRITNRNGQISRFTFGNCGRLIERVDPLGRTLRFSWTNEPRQLESITNAKGETYRFTYDPAGRLISETGFDGRKVHYEVDAAGNLIATWNGAGERIGYQRDALGRLVAQELPDGSRAGFTYDASGLLAQAENGESLIRFERDRLGRLLRETQNGHVIERRFDAANNLRHLQSDLGLRIDYTFDANGLLGKFKIDGHNPITLQRDALGQEIRRLLPGNAALSQQYDGMGRLIEQTLSHQAPAVTSGRETPRTLVQRRYGYDKARLTSIQDLFWGQTTYVYDPAERLTRVLRERGGGESFHYDDNDNLTGIVRGDERLTLEYARGDRLQRRGNTTYHYDDQGRLIEKRETPPSGRPRVWQYTWDALDQLRGVTDPDGLTWHYAYDPFGRRIEKRAPNGERHGFVWDQDVVLHELKNGDLTASWVFDPHSYAPLCKLEDRQLYAVITDHLGTPRELIDRSGKIAWRQDTYAWGQVRETKSYGVDCPVRFQGQWYDSESGLHYNRFRYYDPAAGRFLCQDPIGLIGGMNTYAYAVNPVMGMDPLGLDNCDNEDSESASNAPKKTPKIVEHPSKRAARRAAEREAGMGKHGGREQLPDKPLRPGSRSPQGDPGVRTEVRSTDTGRTVHHDPYGHTKDNIPPHYGVDSPDGTTHHTYPSTHNPQLNR